jgi:hypothetical protein
MNCLITEEYQSVLGCLFVQAKAAHKEELTSSLQKLRGKDFNISHEISDIQVRNSSSRLQTQLFVKVVLVFMFPDDL